MVACNHGITCIHGNLFSVTDRKQKTYRRSIPTNRPNRIQTEGPPSSKQFVIWT